MGKYRHKKKNDIFSIFRDESLRTGILTLSIVRDGKQIF
jgi:hypothetical protein